MTTKVELEMQLTSDPSILSRVRGEVRRWMAEAEWDEVSIAEAERAVDEAVTNVIRHGYGGQAGQPIHVNVLPILDSERGEGLQIVVRDFGVQVEPSAICSRALDDPRPGGLGVHIIRCSMDAAEYSRATGGGMQLVMQKFKRSAARRASCDGDGR